MLKALAIHLQQHLPELYSLSYKTGATKADSWVDIEVGIGNLFSYASLRRKLPDLPYWPEG
jgi:oxepin-CoA hydrolase/3-oxo-5,6-dehydrosuberyl-CoA semialdehyde dehydrogenase